MKVAGENDKAAKRKGDDPYDWWVVDHEIDLSKIAFNVIMDEDFIALAKEKAAAGSEADFEFWKQ